MAVGDPTGADLCVGTTNGDTLPNWGAGYEEREITFGAGTALTSGVKYAIVVRALDAAGERDDSDALVAVLWNTAVYAGGNWLRSTDSGSTWTPDTADDAWFKTKAVAVEKDTYEPTGTLGYEGAFKAWWLAQTFTASSDYTITSVILKMERFQFDTTGTVTVSIKATIGVPEQATILLPTDGANDVTLDQATITWEDGGNADTYDVYYGDNAAAVAAADTTDTTGIYLGNQAAESFTITDITLGSPFDYLITRYWRIDSVNDAGTTTGNAWSFISISFDQLRISYVLISGGSGAGPYDDPAGVEGTDWSWTGLNNMMSVRRLVVAANNKIYYESI